MLINKNLKIIEDDIMRVSYDLHRLSVFDLFVIAEGGIGGMFVDEDSASEAFDMAYAGIMSYDAETLYQMGTDYYNGTNGRDKDHKDAIAYFAAAGAKEHAMAAFNAAYMFLNHEGTETNFVEAYYWFAMAANLGNERGYYFLADFYMTGHSVVKVDHSKAAYLYKISGEMGSSAGSFNYATLLLQGDGVERNIEEGLEYLKASAKMGFVPAMQLADKLGIEYTNGSVKAELYIDFLKKEVEYYNSDVFTVVYESALPELKKSQTETDCFNALINIRKQYYNMYISCDDENKKRKILTYHNACFRLFRNLSIYVDDRNPIDYINDNLTDDSQFNANIIIPLCRIKMAEIGQMEKEDVERIELWRKRAVQALRLEQFGLTSDEFDGKRYIFEDEYAGYDFYDDMDIYLSAFEMIKDGSADVSILSHIADMIFSGKFSKPMVIYACYYYEMAAKKGSADAMFNAGMCYRWGEGGVYVDIDKAMYWFKMAATNGHDNAREIVEKFDNDTGRNILEMSVVHGVQGSGSKWYKHRDLVNKYYEMADAGDVEAQYELARNLVPENEFGAFKRSAEKAAYYYELAAKQGSIDAAFNLANLYLTGSVDFPKDIEQAFKWRKICADMGDGEACYMTGEMYINGSGTEKNEEMGQRYIQKARELGYMK